MRAAALAVPTAWSADPDSRLRQIVLLRLAADQPPASRADLARDLADIVPHRLSPGQWCSVLDREIDALIADGSTTETRGRLQVNEPGIDTVRRFLRAKGNLPRAWSELRDVRLAARALGLERTSVKQIKALKRPEGLRAAVLQEAYGLKIKGIATPARIRCALAAVALERAFGNQVTAGLEGRRSGLSPKAGRLLAAQLSSRPRDFGTDGRLIAALAAERLAIKQADVEALRRAVLRRFLEGAISDGNPVLRPVPQNVAKLQPAMPTAPRQPVSARPDLLGFANEVRRHAVTHAQGWVGNRRAYISHVWRALGQMRPDWDLSEIEFKCMLVEAHRAGQLALANADLKDQKSIKDVQESAVVYKNAVFHFVRVDG